MTPTNGPTLTPLSDDGDDDGGGRYEDEYEYYHNPHRQASSSVLDDCDLQEYGLK